MSIFADGHQLQIHQHRRRRGSCSDVGGARVPYDASPALPRHFRRQHRSVRSVLHVGTVELAVQAGNSRLVCDSAGDAHSRTSESSGATTRCAGQSGRLGIRSSTRTLENESLRVQHWRGLACGVAGGDGVDVVAALGSAAKIDRRPITHATTFTPRLTFGSKSASECRVGSWTLLTLVPFVERLPL